MPIKDVFEYTDRWGSVGLDCSKCVNEGLSGIWPNTNRDYSCRLHKISLAVELNQQGYKEGEWFCKQFHNNGTGSKRALEVFSSIKDQLSDNVLYGLGGKDGYLKEVPFP